MAEKKETVIRFDEEEQAWYFETNIDRHIPKILSHYTGGEEAYETVDKEMKDGVCVSVRAKLSNLYDFTVNPYPRRG